MTRTVMASATTISPKAVLAAVLPSLGGLAAIGVQWVATGALDRNELATAIGAVLASLLAFAGAYAGSPGTVVTERKTIRSSWGARARDQRGQTEPLSILVWVLVIVILVALAFYVLDRAL